MRVQARYDMMPSAELLNLGTFLANVDVSNKPPEILHAPQFNLTMADGKTKMTLPSQFDATPE